MTNEDDYEDVGDDSQEEEEEEFREVDPMQVIEERLMLLESWLQEDPYSEEVQQKREEYLSLMEELEILGRKMRKTDKLLSQPEPANVAKLERKRDQYEREVTDIVLYAEQDQFFDMEGEEGEAALNAYVKANSLLGRPLETLTEMSGFEDSKAWNDSAGVIDYRSDANSISRSPSIRSRKSLDDLDMSKPHNVTILKKKLKKVKNMFENTIDDKEREELLQKVTEYQKILDDAEAAFAAANGTSNNGKHDVADDDDHTVSSHDEDISEASIEVPAASPVKAIKNLTKSKSTGKSASTGQFKTSTTPPKNTPVKVRSKARAEIEDEDYRLLKKKLTKARKMQAKAKASSKEAKKLQKKIDEYTTSLSKHPNWMKDQISFGFKPENGDAVDGEYEDEDEDKWMEQQAAADEKRIAQEEVNQEDNFVRRSHARSMVEGRKRSDDGDQSHREDNDVDDDSLNLDTYVQQERAATKLVRKKLKKIEKMIDEKLKVEGDETRYTKDFRKLQKKRKQYIAELGEDPKSIENASIDMTASSSASLNLSHLNGSAGLGSSSQSFTKAKPSQEGEDDKIALLRRKLKKVEKMMKAAGAGTKEHSKLSKKRKEYMRLLDV